MCPILELTQMLKECFFCHTYCAHLLARVNAIVAASCAVSNRESRYPYRMSRVAPQICKVIRGRPCTGTMRYKNPNPVVRVRYVKLERPIEEATTPPPIIFRTRLARSTVIRYHQKDLPTFWINSLASSF